MQGKCSSEIQERGILAPVTNEVRRAIFSLGNNKSLARALGKLLDSMHEMQGRTFLPQGKLFDQVNATVLAMIPKIQNPTKATDMTPIA